jgi:hypothetical protein
VFEWWSVWRGDTACDGEGAKGGEVKAGESKSQADKKPVLRKGSQTAQQRSWSIRSHYTWTNGVRRASARVAKQMRGKEA